MFKGTFVLDDNGYLDPIVSEVNINFGASDFRQNDWFLEIFTYEFVQFSFVVI